jgi:hypothetical protein
MAISPTAKSDAVGASLAVSDLFNRITVAI